jgi:hypothetical protein
MQFFLEWAKAAFLFNEWPIELPPASAGGKKILNLSHGL